MGQHGGYPEPSQRPITAASFSKNGYTLQPFAQFEVKALVLSAKHFSSGREAQLSPVDLALGWGPMADPDNLSQLRITQGQRFYFYRYERGPPIPKSEIIANSANMHMIPKDRSVENALKAVKRGDTVLIQGRLVNVKASDGWRWNSSATRHDQGNGACEVVYVEKIIVL